MMKYIPKNFEKNYDILFKSNSIQEIKYTVNYLVIEIKKIIEEQTQNIKNILFKDVFCGWYEEMIQHYNKIYRACDTGDYYNALFAGVELTYELDKNFKRIGISPELPKMIEFYDYENLNKMKLIVKEHQKQLEKLLLENGVEIMKFNDIKEFKAYLNKL